MMYTCHRVNASSPTAPVDLSGLTEEQAISAVLADSVAAGKDHVLTRTDGNVTFTVGVARSDGVTFDEVTP